MMSISKHKKVVLSEIGKKALSKTNRGIGIVKSFDGKMTTVEWDYKRKERLHKSLLKCIDSSFEEWLDNFIIYNGRGENNLIDGEEVLKFIRNMQDEDFLLADGSLVKNIKEKPAKRRGRKHV